MRDCPNCGKPSDGLSCGHCGYRDPSTKSQPARDPNWWRCAHEDHGLRCGKPGSVTQSTQGTDRWFCYDHAFPQHAGPRAPKPPGMRPISELLPKRRT
jgi:hypothetical protein